MSSAGAAGNPFCFSQLFTLNEAAVHVPPEASEVFPFATMHILAGLWLELPHTSGPFAVSAAHHSARADLTEFP